MSSESAAKTKKTKKMKMPHIYVLLISITIICAAASWFLPAGEFERALSDAGREMVVPGTYHVIESTPVGFFTLVQSIYNGTVDAAGVIFFVFISYASIGLIIASGAFNGLVASMLRILKGSARAIIIPVFITLIGCASSTIGVFEEMFPFIPIFVGIAIAMGYDAIVGLAIVALGTGLGYSGAVMNPFTVGMAQSIADVPQMSGAGYRIICHIILIAVASFFVIRYALKIQADPAKSLVYGDDFSSLAMDSDHRFHLSHNTSYCHIFQMHKAVWDQGKTGVSHSRCRYRCDRVGNESQGLVFCGTERSIPFDGTCKRFHHGLGPQ